ncbi:MAG: hypothetical protein GX606_06405, partial [Elusimicrobia bacterium]|nr:hypothetical protein [Elusimicrobiota bacterium]
MASCCDKDKKPGLLSNTLFWAAFAAGILIVLSFFIPFFEAFRGSFFGYARIVAGPLALGLLIGGIIDHYVPREYVSFVLAGRRKRNIVYAVLWGFLMTVCSHGILAIAVQLYRKGAAPSSVVAFLLASPWANFPLTLMLIGFFGPAKAALIILSAILTALLTGWIFQILETKGLIEKNPNTLDVAGGFSVLTDFRKRLAAYRLDLAAEVRGIAKG